MNKICKACNRKIGLLEDYIPFLNKDKKKKVYLHKNCYKEFPAIEKKKLLYLGEPIVKFKPEGLVFGVIGAYAYSEGRAKGFKHFTLRKLEKIGISEEMVDEKSIDMFNVYFGALNEKGMQEVEKEIKKECLCEFLDNCKKETDFDNLSYEMLKELADNYCYSNNRKNCARYKLYKVGKKVPKELWCDDNINEDC
jgi:hypothetical protein